MKSITLDVFGRRALVVRSEDAWTVFYLGDEGKRRLATDIFVPASVTECQLEQFVADLCHEWASDLHPQVVRLD
jgi:hypothetical protein